MRPIDADEVIRDLVVFKALVDYSGIQVGNSSSINACIGVIKSATTLDVKPVHAHWIKGAFADITCSNCDFPLCVSDGMIHKLAYCPHCGAKMDEEEKQ